VTISDCQILDARHRGVVLDGVRRGRVSGCTIVDRRTGPARTMKASILVQGASRANAITGNTLEKDSLRVAPGTATAGDNLDVVGAS